jgi:multiple sugar transport system ATP-binding protein
VSVQGELVGTGLTVIFGGGVRALDGVSFRAAPGRVLALLGPSGCGKTTLLRVVAGLQGATSGSLTLDGRPLGGVPAAARDVGFVFQSYALYPHLTVARNLSLALEVRRVPRDEIARRVAETAELLNLADLLARHPAELSGGQQQRVAVGRALIRRPRLYLMDEPLSNLDALLREEMRAELKALFRRLSATVLYVTHDQAEATSLADEVLVLKDGKICQSGPPEELYVRPANLFTATFVGSPRMTVWRGRAEDNEFVSEGVRLPLPAKLTAEAGLCAGIRPEDVEVAEEPLSGGLDGELELAEPLGDRTLLTIRVGGLRLRALTRSKVYAGSLFVRLPPGKVHWFSAATGERISPGSRPGEREGR